MFPYLYGGQFAVVFGSGIYTLNGGWATVDLYLNHSPTLSWTGETVYINNGVSPGVGTTTMTYVYRVNYMDSDNDQPMAGFPKVHIKKGGVDISGSPFSMTEVNPADTNYTVFGKFYYYQTTLLWELIIQAILMLMTNGVLQFAQY